MKIVPKLLTGLGAALVLIAQCFAQTQNIPVPASSINGGRGVIAIVIPSLPSDLCTASNGYCVTGSNIAGYVEPIVASKGAGKPWTTYFLGQTRCAGSLGCWTIQWDGTISSNPASYAFPYLPNVNERMVGQLGVCDSGSSNNMVTTWTVAPAGITVSNNVPTDWTVSLGMSYCYATGGGN